MYVCAMNANDLLNADTSGRSRRRARIPRYINCICQSDALRYTVLESVRVGERALPI